MQNSAIMILDPESNHPVKLCGIQATKFTRQEMRERSPSGVISMDSMMGKTFTTWFLIKCGLAGVAAAYLFDWVIVSVLP